MGSQRVCWGIPGAGKTTFGIALATQWMEAGVSPREIAYLAFTKAAARVAVSRISGRDADEVIDTDFPLFRTIHSLSYMGLKRDRRDVRVVTPSDMKRFAKASGFDGAYAVAPWEDLADVLGKMEDRGRTPWDRSLTAYGLSRISASSVDDLAAARMMPSQFACRTVGFIEADVYRAFVAAYERWKQQDGLVDFTDMLEYALVAMAPLDDCRRVIVDECQDLCPLHYAIIDKLFRDAEEVWWIGDDDQSIFTFSGASPKLFLKRAAQSDYQVELRRTNRYGAEVVDFSQKIIRRVKVRHEKDIIGAPGKGAKISVSGRFEPVTGNILVLHRHVAGCQEVARAYMDRGLPFRNERGKDPLGSTNRIRAWQAIDMLSSGKSTPMGLVRVLVEDEMPSIAKTEGRERLVVHGAKRRLDEDQKPDQVATLWELIGQKILTDMGARVIAERRYELLDHAEDLAYYEKVAKNGHDLSAKNAPIITTIHGSKGREADEVVLFSEMGAKCWQDPDTEHRLAYVGATRTRSNLTICADSLVDWATLKYDYPLGKAL